MNYDFDYIREYKELRVTYRLHLEFEYNQTDSLDCDGFCKDAKSLSMGECEARPTIHKE